MLLAQETLAVVDRIEPLTDSILRLSLIPEQFCDYLAGQYLQLQLGQDWLAYSIANAPLGMRKYELHIRHSLDNPHSKALLEELRAQPELKIRLPYGACHRSRLSEERPLLFLAVGTGFAPIKAIIEQFLAEGRLPPTRLYWAARSQSDLYWHESLLYWQNHLPDFQYRALLKTEGQLELLTLLQKQLGNLAATQLVMAGPFELMQQLKAGLMAVGLPESNLFSDAFE